MNDIEVLEKELRNINNLIEYYTFENLDYDKKYRMEDFKKAIENAIKSLKERQSDKERIKHLSSVSDYETICLECNNLEEQLDIANDRIKDLEEINEAHKKENGELREELEKKNNMYIKEYNEHIEKKRQNGVLINNELILKREIEKKDKLINLMAEQLTTPVHSKEWVIEHYKREVEQ